MRAASVLVVLAGCAPPISYRLPGPPLEGAKSAVLSVRSAQGRLLVAALDLSADWRLERSLAEDSLQVDMLLYACPLAALGIRPGELSAQPGGRLLPAPRVTWSTSASAAAWQRQAAPPAELRDELWAIDPPPCAGFEGRPVRFDNAGLGQPYALVPLDLDSALVSFRDAGVMRFHRDGRVEPLPQEQSPSTHAVDAKIDPDGVITWLLVDGCLERARLGERPVRLACSPAPKSPGWSYLSLSAPGEPEEVVFFYEGSLERWAGGAIEVVASAEPPGAKAGLARVGPGEYIAAGGLPDSIYRLKNGALTTEIVLDVSPIDKVIAAGWSPALGAVLGTNLGHLLRAEGGAWRTLEHGISAQMRVIQPLEHGLLAGGNLGLLTEVLFDESVCPDLRLVNGEVRRLLPVGRSFVALSEPESHTEVTFMDRSDQRPACAEE